MKKLKYYYDWFNWKFGWFFTNGRKQVKYNKPIK